MKTNMTFKHILLALTITLGMAACKKDKKEDPAPPTPAEVKAITFTELKTLSTGASVKVPDAKKITGIVISDAGSKNIDSKTVILQEATDKPGIIITFDAAQTFALGDQVEVVVSNQTLAQENGEIELTNVPAVNAKKLGTGSITAKTTTVAEIATNKAAWDGTLVTIAATELTSITGKFSGTLTIKDASGAISSAVLAGASFENTDLPVSVSSVTGIVRVNNTDVNLNLRKPADAVTGAITRVIVEDFTNVSSKGTNPLNSPFFLQGFTDALGQWGGVTGGDTFWLFPGSKYDADFTTPGRSYVYIGRGQFAGTYEAYEASGSFDYIDNDNSVGSQYYTIPNLAGLKQISITFAGSKISGTGVLTSNIGDPQNGIPTVSYNVPPFDPTKGYFQVAIDLIDPYGTGGTIFMKASPKYTKTGEFYTFTVTIPTTKAELIAAGMTENGADAFLSSGGSQGFINILNLSTRGTGGTGNENRWAPILIDKIVFGF